MEAESKDVSSIQDEDVLRRMWQQTEDFGRKKEIRAHMYKLREARLKEFYTSGEVLKDVQRSNSSPGLRDQHSKNPQWQEGPTHADSLADHSFLSLKTKEIRDSESPTREVQYRNSRNRTAGGDNGVWTISANTEKSDDGKRVTSTRIATTQGSRPVDGGELSYAATNEQLSSVYSDGDANNFTKSVGESSKTFAQQNVVVGNDKNYQSSKSTTSSSSSKVVTHQSSTTGNRDFDDFPKAIQDGGSTATVTRKMYTSEVPSSNVIQDGSTTTTVTRKIYTSDTPDNVSTSTSVVRKMQPDIPDDLKRSIADGNTKVITETKTLPDGSTVTTTRYETKGSKTWNSTSSSSHISTNRQSVEQKSSSTTTDKKRIEYVDDGRDNVKRTVVVTKTVRDPADDYPAHQSYPVKYTDNVNKNETVRLINTERNVYEDDVNRSNTVHVTRSQDVHDQRKVVRRTEDVTEQDHKVINKQDTRDDHPRTNEIVKVTKIVTRNDGDQFQPTQRKRVPESQETYTTVTTTKTSVKSGVSEKVDDNQVHHYTDVKKREYTETPDRIRQVTDDRVRSRDQEPRDSHPQDYQPIESRPANKEPAASQPRGRQPDKHSDEPMTSQPRDGQPMGQRPEDREPAGSRPQNREPAGFRPQDREPTGKYPEESSYRPRDNQPTCPEDTEMSRPKPRENAPYNPSIPTEDQYTTTYRQEYVNKRISVDVSPTHDAFARSLRAVSPDRMSDRPKSRGSLRNSTSSLRSSSSPEKIVRHHPEDRKEPIRKSPDRKPTSDSPRKRIESPQKHSPERLSSPKPVTSQVQPRVSQSPEKKSPRTPGSPDRKPCVETVTRTIVTKRPTAGHPDTSYNTDTITKKKPDDRKSPEKQINSDSLPRKKSSPTQDYSPVRTPSPTKPTDRTSPGKTTGMPRNQESPERPSPIRGVSPTKPIDRSSPVRSPTKSNDRDSPTKSISTTEIKTINTDTITRKKKIVTPEKPEDNKGSPSNITKPTSSVKSPNTEVIITSKTDTIVKKKDSPIDDKPENKPDSEPQTQQIDRNERIISETITFTTKSYPDSPTDKKSPKSKTPNSRDSSPTCSASDIEFINHNSHIVTDLDEPGDKLVPEKRPTSLDIDIITTTTTKKEKQITNKIPKGLLDSPKQKSPVKDSPKLKSPTKSTPTAKIPTRESPTKERTSPLKQVPSNTKRQTTDIDSPSEKPPTYFSISPGSETPVDVCEKPKSKEPTERPPLIRTETYEKRCRQILGLPDKTSPHNDDRDQKPIEEPEFIKKQKETEDEYAGREPVEEPVFVKKHFDMHYRDDELIQENVEKITGHRPRDNNQPENDDYPDHRGPRLNKETTEFILTERTDTDIVKHKKPKETESQPSEKTSKDKPNDKIKRPAERKREPDMPDKKQKTSTLERKSPEKQKYPEAKHPQQKKPNNKDTEDGEYVTEYTDEYCDRPVSKKPDQKVPKDNITKATITETTTVTERKSVSPNDKKPVRDNLSPDRKYVDSKLRQPSKKQPKQTGPDDRDFTTEYIDEYTDKDGIAPKTSDHRIPKESIITTALVDVTKVTEVTDKKLITQIPFTTRKQPEKKVPDYKRTKMQRPENDSDEDTDEEQYTDEYNRTTKVVTTTITDKNKPSDRKPLECVKKPQDIKCDKEEPVDGDKPARNIPQGKIVSSKITETSKLIKTNTDKKLVRESPDKKSPREPKDIEPRQETPDDEECVDNYIRTTKVTSIITGKKPVHETSDREQPEEFHEKMKPDDKTRPKELKDQKTSSNKITSTTTKTIKTTTTPDTKPIREIPLPGSKKPSQDKPLQKFKPNNNEPDDVELVEEYNRTTKITTSTNRKIPVRQSPSPDRKQPQKPIADDTEPVSEYTEEYCKIPASKKTEKIKTTSETSKIIQSMDKPNKPATKKSRIDQPTPDNKEPIQDKRKPKEQPDDDDSDDREFKTEYIDEYCEVTTNETITQKKPSPIDKSLGDIKPKSSPDRKTPSKDEKPVQKRPDVTRQSPSRELPHKTTIITDLTDEYHITNRVIPETDKPYGHKPQTSDFINNEKYDTDITLEILERTRDSPEREPEPSKHITDVHYDINNEIPQQKHIRTHRIDTTVITDKEIRETSPRRYPQKAVPSDTMECTFREIDNVNDDEYIAPGHKPSKPDLRKPSPGDETMTKKLKKTDVPEDRMSPVKQPKQPPKTLAQIKTTKVISKKTTEFDGKRKVPIEEISKRKSPIDGKIAKDKSPIRQERTKQRSPSPVSRTTTKRVVETERVISTQVTPKSCNKDLPTRKIPDTRSKITEYSVKPNTGRTPSESPIRKPLYTSPAAGPERKPATKVGPKVFPKDPVQPKLTEPTKKHVVTKTISLNRKPDSKPQVSPVRSVPKTITTVKTTKITQPSSMTVTTVKTTKTTRKSTRERKIDSDSSDTESEPEIANETYDIDVIANKTKTSVDKKKVVTTAKINITSPHNGTKHQNPNRVKEPEITAPSYKVNSSETIIITTNKTTTEPVTVTTEHVTITAQDKPLTKCITTKSIVLNKDEPIDHEIVIDLQRSTSSRESSPDKICPIPVSSEDETGYPRYPDEVSEPDDILYRRKPQKITDIPLTEEEDVRDFSRITEVPEPVRKTPGNRITKIDKVTDTDESLLSVTEKVSRFINTAEKLTFDDQPKSKKPAPKVPRPELVVTDDLVHDECLLSVSDKVSKFITTAEHVSTRKPERPQSPVQKSDTMRNVKVEDDDECLLSVTEKVSHFIQAAETVKQKPAQKEPASKVPRPEFNDIDETLKTDECLLSVTDKVSKFLTTAEQLTSTEIKTTKSEPKEKTPSRQPSPEKMSPDTSKLRQSPTRKTPERSVRKSPKPEPDSFCQEPKRKSPEVLPKTAKRPEATRPVSQPEPRPVNLKSSEAVRKAKAMFENITKTQEVPKQRDILSRPSIWEGNKKPEIKPTDQQPGNESDIKLISIDVYKKKEPIVDVRKQLTYTSDEEEETYKSITTNLKDVALKSTKLILNEKKMSYDQDSPKYTHPSQEDRPSKFTSKVKHDSPERDAPNKLTQKPKQESPSSDIPGYMRPLGKHQHPSHEDIPSKFNHKFRHGSPERDMPSKLIQKPRHGSPDRDMPGYMRPLGKHEHPSHEDLPNKSSQKPTRGSPERDMSSKLIQKPRHSSPDRDMPGYMRPLGKHEHPSHEDIPSKVAHKPRSGSPEKDMQTKSTYRSRHSSPEDDTPGYMRPTGRHDSPRDGTTHKYTHKPRHSSPERESPTYIKSTTKTGTVTREEIKIEKKSVLKSRQTPDRDVPGYMRPVAKVSPEDRDKYILETRSHPASSPDKDSPNYKKSVVEHEEYDSETRTVHRHRYPEDDDIPGYMRPLNRCLTPDRDVHTHKKTVIKEEEIIDRRHRNSTPDREVPGYMKPLQRHGHSPDRDIERVRDVVDRKRMPLQDDVTSPINTDSSTAGKKFGVTLRRTDSGRMVTTTSTTITERRRSSTPGQLVIEDIEDLDLLEKMMDKVVGYEQRRRIRSQIRVVRRLISENKIQYTTNSLDRKKPHKQSSPVRESLDKERRSPNKDIKKVTSQAPVKKSGSDHNNLPENKVKYQRMQEKEERKTEIKSSYTRDEQTIESVTSEERSMSPEPRKKPQTASSVYKPDLKHVQLVSKVVSDDKPSWVTNRNLKKTMTETVTEERRTNVPLKKKETPRRSPSPQKEVIPTDCITSSYGIGPTDENGQPLFGIRALRKAATDKVQVRGTVVTSQFYSEDGNEPIGEVSVTKYSNNPKELEMDDEEISKTKGFASVTTTQKFGTRGTPTLKTMIDNKKAISDKQSEEEEIFKTTSTKVTRRGSVKALSQKFIDNAVEISRNERQTYPKAGLILRTSSFKETAPSSERSSSRESSPGYQGRSTSGKISLESITSDSRNNSTAATTRHTDETKTFLNSHTRVANAQEVITRMKNAEKEDEEDDSPEDREARMLLNKFLGAQVLMSGMEPLLANKAAGTATSSAQLVRKVQKTKTVTSSTKESGNAKPSVSLTKRFQCPITPEVLEDIWDEQTLRLLLEQCTDYEERRHIRARLRQVMAEQEAVANVVASAVAERDGDADRTTGNLQGESLLLPLLQELLEKKGSQQQQQQQQGLMNRSASSQSSEESATATVDSGTESGEDLRLLAVGLCDTIDSTRSAGVEPLGPGLLAEVQSALSRLAVSLQIESADVQMEPGKRQSLLQLVARLQANLVVPAKPPTERRSSANQGRFARHKSRQNRHTVGVSSEELAAARKLMEEVVLRDSLSNSATPEYVPTPPDYTLQKQNSDGCVSSSSSQSQYRSVNFSPQATTPVKNATAKPFTYHSVTKPTPDANYHNQQQSLGYNKSVSEPATPRDRHISNEVVYREKNNHGRQSLNLDSEHNPFMVPQENVRPISECLTMDTPNTWSSLSLNQKAKLPSHSVYSKPPEFACKEIQESETDDDSSTVKHSEDTDDTRQSVGPTPTQLHYVTDVKTVSRTISPVQEPMNSVGNSSISSRTVDYEGSREKDDLFNGKDLSAAQRLLNMAINDDAKTGNRFNTKKLKMKRANTIDIPKPLNFYMDDDDSDDSMLDREEQVSTRRSNYLALRGPIRVGHGGKSTVPSFEPKTENDKKFMAFIQKHNNNSTNATSLWCNKNSEPVKKSTVADQNWNRKFGNIKTVFEREEDKSRPGSATVSSAKQFWQTADDAVNAGRRSYNGPKISKQGTRQLQSLFEQKQQETKLPWTQTEHNNVVTGTLKVESNFKPIQNSQLIQGKNYKFVPQPLPVNKFSHAPMSAFQPPPKRTPVPNSVPVNQSWVYPTGNSVAKQPAPKTDKSKKADPETPLFLYTPKQPEFPEPDRPQDESKPTGRAPWVSGNGHQSEHRVLSLAASKFENAASREVSPQPNRKPSKDKVYIPPILLNNTVDTYNQPSKQSANSEQSKDLSSPYLVKNIQPSKQQVRKLSGEYVHPLQNKVDSKTGFRTPNPQMYKASSAENNNSYAGKQDSIESRDPVVQTVKQTVQKFSDYDSQNDGKVIYKHYTEPNRKGPEEQLKVQMINKADISYKQPTVPFQASRRVSGEFEHPNVQSYQTPPQNIQQNPSKDYHSSPQHFQASVQSYQQPANYQKAEQNYTDSSKTSQPSVQDYQKAAWNYPVENYPNQSQDYSQNYQSPSHSTKPETGTETTSSKATAFEYPSSESSMSAAVTPDALDEPQVQPFTEYKAVSKVMTGPVSQQAVTVTQKTPKRREDHDTAARNLQNVLKSITSSEDRDESASRRTNRPSLSPNPSVLHKPSVSPAKEPSPTINYEAQSIVTQSPYPTEQNLKPLAPEQRVITPNYASQTQYEQKSYPLEQSNVPNYASQVQYSNKAYDKERSPSAFAPVNESAKINLPNYSSQVQYSNKQYEQPTPVKPVIKDTVNPNDSATVNKPNYASQYSNKPYDQHSSSAFKPVSESARDASNKSHNSSQNQYASKHSEMEHSSRKTKKVSQLQLGGRQCEIDPSKTVPKIQVNTKPISMESLEINDDGESVVTTKLQIPVHNRIVQYNNTTNAARNKEQHVEANSKHAISRSDSWHKLSVEQQVTSKPSPRASPKARNILQKAKSSHSLAVPNKQFEAGMSRDEVETKKKTVAAYFGASQPLSKTSSSSNVRARDERTKSPQSAVTRMKTDHKVSIQSRSSGLARSRTMPDVADMIEDALDIDEEFENIFQRIETTKKTVSEGPVTTTQVSSTRVISSSRQVSKPISPFAKFRQLDKQNSLNSPPSSPRTPGGGSGAPLFKFTDPALSHSASTVKDRLLHWCQMKTKEYQNIKLENFSTCWADGMAFCALIHHFLPDAFDYHALTPQQRRHNFTLAFKVADEQAGIAPLLDVDDMVAMRRPDWKCVFTYVQSIYRRFKDED